MRPRLLYACFVMSRIPILCYMICHCWRTHTLDKQRWTSGSPWRQHKISALRLTDADAAHDVACGARHLRRKVACFPEPSFGDVATGGTAKVRRTYLRHRTPSLSFPNNIKSCFATQGYSFVAFAAPPSPCLLPLAADQSWMQSSVSVQYRWHAHLWSWMLNPDLNSKACCCSMRHGLCRCHTLVAIIAVQVNNTVPDQS